MATTRDRIRRLVVEVRASSREEAVRVQRVLGGLGQRLERALGELESAGEPGVVRRIDRVELDLGRVDLERLEEVLVDGLREEILSVGPGGGRDGGPEVADLPEAHRSVEQLRHVLLHGTLPWHADRSRFLDLDGLLRDLMTDRASLDVLLETLPGVLADGGARRRLLAGVEAATLRLLLASTLSPGAGELAEMEEVLTRVRRQLGRSSPGAAGELPPRGHFVFEALLEAVARREAGGVAELYRFWARRTLRPLLPPVQGSGSEPAGPEGEGPEPGRGRGSSGWESLLETLPEEARRALAGVWGPSEVAIFGDPELRGGDRRREPARVERERAGGPEAGSADDGTERDDEAVRYVENAGVVLLWPYLSRYFERLGLVEDGGFRTPEDRSAAACELEHLVRGGEEFREFDLVLNRILCGFGPRERVERIRWEGPADPDEADRLLAHAVEHWGALGGTSTDGFRTAFLRREGRLTRESEDAWSLVVRRRGPDVLLARLPYPIGVVALPWMECRLHVEW